MNGCLSYATIIYYFHIARFRRRFAIDFAGAFAISFSSPLPAFSMHFQSDISLSAISLFEMYFLRRFAPLFCQLRVAVSFYWLYAELCLPDLSLSLPFFITPLSPLSFDIF